MRGSLGKLGLVVASNQDHKRAKPRGKGKQLHPLCVLSRFTFPQPGAHGSSNDEDCEWERYRGTNFK